jgi:hypothetical protein
MTISSSSTNEPTVDRLVINAYRIAGLLNENEALTTVKGNVGREMLDMVCDDTQTFGLFERTVKFYDLALTVGVYTYDLPANVLDVVGTGMYIDPDQDVTAAESETTVTPIDRETWQVQASKAMTGRPLLYFPYRAGAVVELRLWPIPDAAGTIRLQTHQLRADTILGASTPDFERYWGLALVWSLAYQLAFANSVPLQRCTVIKATATEHVNRCRAYSNRRTGSQMVPSY